MADSNMKSSIHVAHEYTDLADILPSSEEDRDGCIDKKVKEKELDEMFERKKQEKIRKTPLVAPAVSHCETPSASHALHEEQRGGGQQFNNLPELVPSTVSLSEPACPPRPSQEMHGGPPLP